MPTEDATSLVAATDNEPVAPAAPRYNLMDRDVQPPGYNVYREKKEGFTDCAWHLWPAEICMCYYVAKEKGGCCSPSGCLAAGAGRALRFRGLRCVGVYD